MRLIDVPMLENDIGAATVGEFLKTLLITLWEEGEGFSGKRPFGNSDWQYQVYASLIKAGCIIGKFDEDGYINDADYQKADRIIKDAVREVFDAVPVVRCKDCKHWDENYEICLPDNERGCKCKMFTVDEGALIYTAPTGYCWCGKKEV